MSTTTRKPPIAPPSLIEKAVETLSLLVDEEKYAQMLADTIMTPVDNERDAALVQAFRDPRLINRSVAAANYLVTRANNDVKKRAGNDAGTKDLRARTEAYKARVGRERQILKAVLSGLKAQRGILDTAPNPRARATERLVTLNMKGDVPKGLFKQLLAEEEQKVRDAKKAAKERAREAARAARAGNAPDARTDARTPAPRQGESTRSFTDRDMAGARARGAARTPRNVRNVRTPGL